MSTLQLDHHATGWTLSLGRRVHVTSPGATSRMWPCIRYGGDENCNPALTFVAWPLGMLDVFFRPGWRTNGFCDECKAMMIAEGMCPKCGAHPCWCDEATGGPA